MPTDAVKAREKIPGRRTFDLPFFEHLFKPIKSERISILTSSQDPQAHFGKDKRRPITGYRFQSVPCKRVNSLGPRNRVLPVHHAITRQLKIPLDTLFASIRQKWSKKLGVINTQDGSGRSTREHNGWGFSVEKAVKRDLV